MNRQPVPFSTSPTATHQQVELALRPRVMQHHLSCLYGQDTDDQRTPAACHILDAKVEPGAHCSILYQLGERLVIGKLQWPALPDAPASTAALRLAEMQIYSYEQDPALPGLTTVLDGQQMAALLNTLLPECAAGDLRILRCQVTPLRYRLGRRCTVRFDLRLRQQANGAIIRRTLYGKLYHSARKAQAVYTEMGMLSAKTGVLGILQVAQAVAFAPTLPMVFQAPVQGTPLELWLYPPKRTTTIAPPHAVAGIRQAGAALATLHQVEMSTDRERPVADELVRFQQRSAQISAVNPTTGAALRYVANALPAWLAHLPLWGAERSVVHGDCKPSQFFLAEDANGAPQVALLDFDHCGIADPAADVGNFLATLRQTGVKYALKQRDAAAVASFQRWLAALEEEFLTAYLATRPCHAAFRQRVTWYQAVALLRKALRSFSRSPRSPLPTLLAQAAGRALATLPTPGAS